jgi:hypothetical protein
MVIRHTHLIKEKRMTDMEVCNVMYGAAPYLVVGAAVLFVVLICIFGCKASAKEHRLDMESERTAYR